MVIGRDELAEVFGTLITDDGISEANHRMLTEAGIRVIIARPSAEFS